MTHKLATPVNSLKALVYSFSLKYEIAFPEIQDHLKAFKETLF